MRKLDIIDIVQIEDAAAEQVKKYVSNFKFYSVTRSEKFGCLESLFIELVHIHDIGGADNIRIEDTEYESGWEDVTHGRYEPWSERIVIKRPSMITFLKCFREASFDYSHKTPMFGDLEVDKTAWACMVFKTACPKSFEKSVRAGNIKNVVWDEGEDKAMMLVSEAVAEIVNINL